MTFAVIKNNRVVNVTVGSIPGELCIEIPEGQFVGIGNTWDGIQFAAYVQTPEELQAEVIEATQKRLDDFAKTRNYDGILSACTYAGSIPQFASEGQYAVNARDNTWATLYTILAEVQAGTRPMPTGFADVEPLLPVLAWPV